MTITLKTKSDGTRIVAARMTRRLIVPFTFAVMAIPLAQAFAQGAFPAPLPGEATSPTSNAVLPPEVNGTPPLAGSTSDACRKEFIPLREEAAERGKLIRAASERHAPPGEACKLIENYFQSEIKMIVYIEANSARCGIPPEIADRLKAGHKNTAAMQTKVCRMAREAQTHGPDLNESLGPQKGEPAGPVGDFDVHVPH